MYTELGRLDDAIISYQKALSLNPMSAEAHGNLGNTLQSKGKSREALDSYLKALSLRPNYAEALNNCGVALEALGRYDEALTSYDKAQAIKPDYVDAHYNESLCRLRMGDFERGWEKFEWRWRRKEVVSAWRKFRQPLWLGEEKIAGKTILLHSEQGLGDTIQFCRYAALVAAQGATVLMEVPTPLRSLLSTLEGVSQMAVIGERVPPFDHHCPLLSLPLALKTTMESIPAKIPYLSVNRAAAAAWRARLAPDGDKLVGICWRGNPDFKDDHKRSIRFDNFAPLLSAPGVRFVSLQKELTDEERRQADSLPLVHPGVDFKSTAELIAALDLVISVDTAWAHWAGAIGKPFWVLLSFGPDWRWLLERDDSPWYPTARVFRQPKYGDWDSVIEKIKHKLAVRYQPSGKTRAAP